VAGLGPLALLLLSHVLIIEFAHPEVQVEGLALVVSVQLLLQAHVDGLFVVNVTGLLFVGLEVVDHVKGDQIEDTGLVLLLDDALDPVEVLAVAAEDDLGHFLDLVEDVFEAQLEEFGFVRLQDVQAHLEETLPAGADEVVPELKEVLTQDFFALLLPSVLPRLELQRVRELGDEPRRREDS